MRKIDIDAPFYPITGIGHAMRVLRSFVKQGNKRLQKMANQSSLEFSYLMMVVADTERLLDNYGDKAITRPNFVGSQESESFKYHRTDPTARGIVCERAGVFRYWMAKMEWQVPE